MPFQRSIQSYNTPTNVPIPNFDSDVRGSSDSSDNSIFPNMMSTQPTSNVSHHVNRNINNNTTELTLHNSTTVSPN